MLHLDEVGPRTPRLPRSRWAGLLRAAGSMAVHAAVLAGVVGLAGRAATRPSPTAAQFVEARRNEPLRVIFVVRDELPHSRGGGGGGNRQPGPIRRAQGVGSDTMTLRVARPIAVTPTPAGESSLPGVILDAKPLASGLFNQIGLPEGGEPAGLSTGPGSGGGVGTGTGTGIGSGMGPGVGPGSGGGTGGGVYRPGGNVTPPRLKHQVKPTYTNDALVHKIQGTVLLEAVVTREGRPTEIRVVRSLDPGLDQQAVLAASQWQFEPGRLNGSPVDVLVTIMLDFWIH